LPQSHRTVLNCDEVRELFVPGVRPPDLDLIKQEKQELSEIPRDQKRIMLPMQQRERRRSIVGCRRV
jgi:hypothetical protein